MPKACLIIFTRYPEPGKTKTRLIPALGIEGAALLHQQMAEYTVQQARTLQQSQSLAIEIWFVGGNIELMQTWLGKDLVFREQPEGDLGDRMSAAFQTAFNQGYTAVIIVGTDCPELNTALLAQGFAELQNHPLTLGPALDGGYYLIGLRQFVPELFTKIPWSTAAVLSTTLKIADRLALNPNLLPYLQDIDTPQDLIQAQSRLTTINQSPNKSGMASFMRY
jgi:uncharacterized protein